MTMTRAASSLGPAEGSLATPTSSEPFLYEGVIPQLGPALPGDTVPSLLPALGGLPGLTYYQWPVELLAESQDIGLAELENGKVYRISGPSGTIACKLLAEGKVIRGADIASNRRTLYLHRLIRERTGLVKQGEAAPEPEPEAVAVAAESAPTAPKPKLPTEPLKKKS